MNKISLPLSACNEIKMGDESPGSKVKFLCSYGGKVLPRPSDGLLRYVGGETRVVSVPREITFAELMKKVSSMVEGVGEMVLKYQLALEDLDALVSVRTEEDVKHMIEEHDRHHTGGLLRAFLFPPSKQTGLVAGEPYLLEQRYIDAINGIFRASPRKGSACSSPKSNSPDASPRFSISNSLHRVQSSPTLTNLGVLLDHQQYQYHHPNFHLSRPPQDPQRLLAGRAPAFNRQPSHRGYSFYDDSPPAYAHDRLHAVSRSPRRKSIWE